MTSKIIKAKYITTSYGIWYEPHTRYLFETKDGTILCIDPSLKKGKVNYYLGWDKSFETGKYYDVDLADIDNSEDANYLIEDEIRLRKFYASLSPVEAA